jgi:hypothetical protein
MRLPTLSLSFTEVDLHRTPHFFQQIGPIFNLDNITVDLLSKLGNITIIRQATERHNEQSKTLAPDRAGAVP